jgi:hypothetical protein
MSRSREYVIDSNPRLSWNVEHKPSDHLKHVFVVEERCSTFAKEEMIERSARTASDVGINVHIILSGECLQRVALVEGGRFDEGIRPNVDRR